MTTLRTPRLSLVPSEPQHLSALLELLREREMRRYLFDEQVVSEEEASKILADSVDSFRQRGFGVWLLRPNEGDPSWLGFCSLRSSDPAPPDGGEEIEIVYGLAPHAWGRGLATEAGLEVLRFGLSELRLPRIAAQMNVPNTASARVAGRLGMQYLGRFEADFGPYLRYCATQGGATRRLGERRQRA